MKAYDHRKIEGKWQKHWAAKKLHQAPDKAKGKDNFYLLTEFPYPSGNLHVGHWYAFAIPDILARHMRMRGKNVMYPIGFDAFGLPAENAAIKNNLNPKKWTKGNIAYMKKQLASMGASFDWSREVQTIDPAYYKWTQWLFLQFFKKGLAYRKETAVNWCPKDKTVLANEQVVNGKCERCDSEVEQRKMLQWNLKITEYADRLNDDLAPLDWPEQIKDSQRNWIGRSEGAEIDFPLHIASDKKYKFVILHGYQGRPDSPKWRWVKAELEALGHEVIIPTLPNTNEPVESEQVATALAATDYDENTVLVGHSLGAVVAMKALQQLKTKIARLVLIAPAIDPAFPGAVTRPFHKHFDWDIDYELLKKLAPNRVLLSDLKEPIVRVNYIRSLAPLIDAQLIETHAAKEHFVGDKEPDILMWLRPTIRVFTTRPDTLFGATYLVLSPEHQWVQQALKHATVLKNNETIQEYVTAAGKKTELERQESREKTGVKLDGVHAINPANGQKIPVYIADYVLAHYGTGAIMAVPAHDERDFAFAQKFGLPIVDVVEGRDDEMKAFTGEGKLINSGAFNDSSIDEAKSAITAQFGMKKTTYKMRDWVVSRQRYWGVPIPIIHCPNCGDVAVPDKDLPVKLPEVKDYLPTGDGKSPLAKVKKFVEVKCPECKGNAERETDTFDTFVDSSWYFQRYTDPKNKKQFADLKKLENWMPVDLYSGGAEHTTMHLLYSRFWHKAMFDLGLVGESEPYVRRMNRSLIMGPDGQKMSKSRGNVIDPDAVVKELGADTVRLYLAFIGPYNEVASYPWSPDGVVGVRRFLERIWRMHDRLVKEENDDVERALHIAIKKVSEDIPLLKFNTAIAALMTFLNEAEGKGITKKQYALLLRLLAPFAPHISDELWSMTGGKKSIHLEKWPAYDIAKTVADNATIAVQVNGKTRTQVVIPIDASEADTRSAAEKAAEKWLENRTIRRAIVVPNRLVNFVID